jgi:predicted RNA-binding protein with PUA-like domain
VIGEAHAESKAPEWDSVDLKAVADVPQPVTLAAIKAEPKLKDMVLVKNARLSVQPVSDSEWALVCRMGGVDKGKAK